MEAGLTCSCGCGQDIDWFALAKEHMGLCPVDIQTYSPLALAYIGDAVYELLIRTKVVNLGNTQVNKMHKKSSSLVKASAQAELLHLLEPDLTQEELAVYRRGRNARSSSSAKHASMIDYRTATGFEALMGYLYLTEQTGRLFELVGLGLERYADSNI